MQSRDTERQNSDNDSRLIELIRELSSETHIGLNLSNINLNSSLEKDAGIDSLARIELLLRIEKEFGKTLPEDLAIGAETIADLAAALESTPVTCFENRFSATERIIVKQEDEDSGYPENAETLVEVLQWHAARHPNKLHVHLYSPGSEESIPVTYGELYTEACYVSAGLRNHDILPGDRVGIMLPTSREYLTTFFGILFTGAIPIPIYPPGRIAQIEEHLRKQLRILENAKAKLLISLPEAIRLAPLIKSGLSKIKEILTYDVLVENETPVEPFPVNKSDIAFIQYTSGSTGNPKGVVLSHANLVANVKSMGHAVDVQPDDVIVSWLPLYHDMGLIGCWFGSLMYGIPLVLMSPLSFVARPSRWLRAIHQYKGTISAAPNFAYELCASRISDEELSDIDLKTWRRALNGAEPVIPDTLDKFINRFAPMGFRRETMAPVFGLAENSVGLLFPPPKRGPVIENIERDRFINERIAEPASNDDPDALRFVSCGSPIKNNEIRIVDSNGHTLGDRKVGLMQFRGPSATSMYYNQPEATEILISEEWRNTGDFAYTANGEVFIAGRQKELIIRGGRNIYPYELEEAVGHIQGVRKGGVAVFGSIDKESGIEKLIVLAETRERKPEKLEKIKEIIREKSIQLFQIQPDDIVLADLRTVLKTSSGKIRRAACRSLYETGKLGKTTSVTMQFFHLALSSIPVLSHRIFNRITELSYAAYGWLLAGLLVPPVWLIVAISPGIRFRFFILRLAARTIIRLSGTRCVITGKENILADRPLIIVSNHASYLDPLFIISAFKQPLRFIVKGELKNKFFPRIFLNRINAAYVERYDAQGGINNIRKIQEDLTKNSAPAVFFAEGTFTELPGLQPFRMGAFILATQLNAKILPVSLRGTREKMRDVDFFLRRGDVGLTISPPVKAAEEGWSGAIKLRNIVRDIIARDCGEKDLICK